MDTSEKINPASGVLSASKIEAAQTMSAAEAGAALWDTIRRALNYNAGLHWKERGRDLRESCWQALDSYAKALGRLPRWEDPDARENLLDWIEQYLDKEDEGITADEIAGALNDDDDAEDFLEDAGYDDGLDADEVVKLLEEPLAAGRVRVVEGEDGEKLYAAVKVEADNSDTREGR